MPDSHFARHAFGDAAQHSAAGAQPRGWTPTPAADLAADLAASHPHYRILRLLDHGGMGAVYVATDTRPGAAHPEVAIKVLRHDALDDPAYVARFHREIALLQQLQHPGIVPVLDYGQTTHRLPFFVMPCLHGRTLHTVLQGPRLSEPRSLDIMAQLCASVAAAHEQHIVHRDLKPQNIFLIPDPAENGRDRVIVLDYGIARSRHTTPLTVPAQSPGTFGYIAPEVLCGGEAGYPADIFALGVICHQLLTGNDSGVPFAPRLEPVVAKAMHNFPEKRFQTATEFAEALQQSIPTGPAPKPADQPPQANPPMPVPAHPKKSLIRPLAIVTALAALAAGVWHKYGPFQQTMPGQQTSPSTLVSVAAPGQPAPSAHDAATPSTSPAPQSAPAMPDGAIQPVDVDALTREIQQKHQAENRNLINAAVQEFIDAKKSATPPVWPDLVGLYGPLKPHGKYLNDQDWQIVFHPNGVFSDFGIGGSTDACQQLGRLIVVGSKAHNNPRIFLKIYILDSTTGNMVELRADGTRRVYQKLPKEDYLRTPSPSDAKYPGERLPIAPSGWYKPRNASEEKNWDLVLAGDSTYFFGINGEAHRKVSVKEKPAEITPLRWLQEGQVVLLGDKLYWIERMPGGLGNASQLWSEDGVVLQPVAGQ